MHSFVLLIIVTQIVYTLYTYTYAAPKATLNKKIRFLKGISYCSMDIEKFPTIKVITEQQG